VVFEGGGAGAGAGVGLAGAEVKEGLAVAAGVTFAAGVGVVAVVDLDAGVEDAPAVAIGFNLGASSLTEDEKPENLLASAALGDEEVLVFGGGIVALGAEDELGEGVVLLAVVEGTVTAGGLVGVVAGLDCAVLVLGGTLAPCELATVEGAGGLTL